MQSLRSPMQFYYIIMHAAGGKCQLESQEAVMLFETCICPRQRGQKLQITAPAMVLHVVAAHRPH